MAVNNPPTLKMNQTLYQEILIIQGQVLFTWASARKAVPRYAHKPLLALRQGTLASPQSLKARLRVLPYLMKMGLGKEEVDGDVVVKNPSSGIMLHTGFAPFRRLT